MRRGAHNRIAALAAVAAFVGALGGAFLWRTAQAGAVTPEAAGAGAGAPAPEAAGAHDAHKTAKFTWLTWDAAGSEKEDPSHDYGPGFIFMIVNFVLLLVVLGRLLGKSIQTSVVERHKGVVRALEEAEAAKRRAEERHAVLERKIKSLETDAQQLRDEVRTEAEKEARLILQRAQARAERLASDAERAIASDVLAARKALEREVAVAAIAAATQLLRTKIEPEDKRRLEDEYLKQVS